MEHWIEETISFVKEQLRAAESGHDFSHVQRVHHMASRFAAELGASMTVVELAALLHDVADAKFHGGDEEAGPQIAAEWMKSIGVYPDIIAAVTDIIRNMSFRHSYGQNSNQTIEFRIVQDADRLDAIGAIGIARAFSYGGFRNRPFYDDSIPPMHFSSSAEYTKSKSPTINHFYEKLLLLKDMLHTDAAKKIAEQRHDFMYAFLKQFDAEKEGTA
jgi:uncharacterized protein